MAEGGTALAVVALLAAVLVAVGRLKSAWRRWLALTILILLQAALAPATLAAGDPLTPPLSLALLAFTAAWSARELRRALSTGENPREAVAPLIFPIAVLGVKRKWWSTGYAAQLCGLSYVEFVEKCRKLRIKLWEVPPQDLNLT